MAARKDGRKNSPGQGRPTKAEDQKIVKRIVGLYAWEWDELMKPGEGQAKAIRRVLKELRQRQE